MTERESYTTLSLQLHLVFLNKITESTDFQTHFKELLLQTATLNNEISSTTSQISLEHSQQLKFLNQQTLILLHKYIRHEEKLLEQLLQYQTLLVKCENEPTRSDKIF